MEQYGSLAYPTPAHSMQTRGMHVPEPLAIDVEWLPFHIKVTVDIDVEDKNPTLAHLLWKYSPFNSLQSHALVSGDHMYCIAPIPELVYVKPEYRVEDRTKCSDGTMFLSSLRHLAIKYGQLTEYLPAAPVGHVRPEDMSRFREAGDLCWHAATKTHMPVEVRVTRHGEPFPGYRLPDPPPVSSVAVGTLMQRIRAATQTMWLEPPVDLVNVHTGNIPSRAGSRDQWYTPMIFVNGETRPLGYGAIDGLIRLAYETSATLQQLKVTAPHFIRVPAEFLGYCGLNENWEFVQKTLDVLCELQTKAEFMALFEVLGLYVNTLNAWNLQLFPWGDGWDKFQYTTQYVAEEQFSLAGRYSR